MNVLMGHATAIQLNELSQCSYQPLAEVFHEILPREMVHAALGENGVKRIFETNGAAKREVQSFFEYWRPRVAASFGAPESKRFDMLKKFGLRHRANDELLNEWRKGIDQYLRNVKIVD